MTPRARTFLIALLAAVVAVRVSASQPLTAAAARIAPAPDSALRHAFAGWTDLNTLGGASAQGVRDLPLAAWFWIGDQVGLDAAFLQAGWRVAVVVIAVVGAVRLVRMLGDGQRPGRRASEPWTPWVAALLFGAGVVLVPVLVRSPLDGLAAGTLPWLVAPLLSSRPLGWGAAAGSAAWIGVAGVGSLYWAAAALVAGVLAAVVHRLRRRELLPVLRWLCLTALASAWWVAVGVWELGHVRDVSGLLGDPTPHDAITDLFGMGTPFAFAVLLAVALGPLATVVLALVVRPAGAHLAYLTGLVVTAVIALVAWGSGLWVPVVIAPAAGDPSAGVVGPALGLLGLGALIAWVPLIAHLVPWLRTVRETHALPASVSESVTVVGGVLVVLLAVGGIAAAAVERGSVGDTAPLRDQVAAWSHEADPGRVLVLPAGDERATEIGLALGDRPWVARGSLPISGPGATAALDDVLARLGRGDGGPGTLSALHRLGIAYVLIEFGGSADADRSRPSALVRSALLQQGATRVRVLVGNEVSDGSGSLLDLGVRGTTPQVEVWSVGSPRDTRVYAGQPAEVVGDAGSVSDLANAGVPDDRAVRLTDDPSSVPLVVSDSARRRDVDQRVAVDPYGPDLEEDQTRLVVPSDAAPVTTTVRRIEGADSVTASSSASDVHAQRRRDGADSYAAIDSNVFTAWQSEPGTGVGQWWQIDLGSARSLSGAAVQLVRSAFAGNEMTKVRVTTDAGSTDVDVPADGLLKLDATDPTTTLRIATLAVNGETGPADSVGIAEVTIPGVEVRAPLLVSGPAPSGWLLAARPGSWAHCVPATPIGASAEPSVPAITCSRSVSVSGADAGSLQRIVDNPEGGTVSGRAWVRAVGTAQAATLADRLADPSVTVTSSSVASQDLANRAQAAADDDPTTAWRPSSDDAYPTLTLSWDEPAELTALRLSTPADTPASTPLRVRVAVTLSGDGRKNGSDDAGTVVTTEAEVGEDGLVALPGDRTKQVTITLLEDSNARIYGSVTGAAQPVPIAIGEVELVGGPQVRYDADDLQPLPCGSGPVVSVSGTEVETRVSTSARAVVAGETIRATLCGSTAFPAGEVEVDVVATFTWLPLGLLLWQAGGELARPDDEAAPIAALPSYRLLEMMSSRRSTGLGVGDPETGRTVAIAVPAGDGWSARSASGVLRPVVLDGWAQGWLVPQGDERVVLSYPPADSLRAWSVVGAVSWGLIVLVGLGGVAGSVVGRIWPRRRSD